MNEGPLATSSPPEEIRRLLDRFPEGSPPHGAAGAAVLIVLRPGRNDVETLLIERAIRPGDLASGQIGLPGGRVVEGEGALVHTALRESQEEVGIGAGDLLQTPRFVQLVNASVFGLTVGVFAAELGPSSRSPSAASPSEVSHVFWLPRASLRQTRRVLREGIAGAREVDATISDGHVLWGFTRRVLLDFFEIVAETAPP